MRPEGEALRAGASFFLPRLNMANGLNAADTDRHMVGGGTDQVRAFFEEWAQDVQGTMRGNVLTWACIQ